MSLWPWPLDVPARALQQTIPGRGLESGACGFCDCLRASIRHPDNDVSIAVWDSLYNTGTGRQEQSPSLSYTNRAMTLRLDSPVQRAWMRRRFLLVTAAFIFGPRPTIAAEPWRLISPDEEARDGAAPQMPAPLDLPPPPTINLVRPDISRPINNPATIEVRFGPGRSIDTRTLWAARHQHHATPARPCRGDPERVDG
jgi:hypothetical protein